MEGTPLRSVPARPAGPVGRPQALAVVEERLPDLGSPARRALALVALVGVSRDQTARELGMSPDELSKLLASGRKALRRTLEPLPAGGWCERAERFMSDRFDGELAPRSTRRLDVHLRACVRCQTHERRLVQAHDELVAALDSAQRALPALRLVETPKALPPGPEPVVPEPAVAEELGAVVERSLERRIAAVARHMAFALAVLLAVAVLVIAVLAATGTIRHVP